MREKIIKHCPNSPKKITNLKAYLKNVEEQYVTDAYHSLSIEGYRVSVELIEKVRRGNWRPDRDQTDQEQQFLDH